MLNMLNGHTVFTPMALCHDEMARWVAELVRTGQLHLLKITIVVFCSNAGTYRNVKRRDKHLKNSMFATQSDDHAVLSEKLSDIYSLLC